jgi:DDE family transposase
VAKRYREATMERELWPRLYHLVMEVGEGLRLVDVTFQPHIVLLVFFWAALHDRPVCWACNQRNWRTTTLRPTTLPSTSTMSRRLRRVDTAMLMRAVVAKIRAEGDETLIAVIDGKPLPVGGASGDPEARCGRGAGMFAKGYKLFAVWGCRPAPEVFRVYPMNKSEDKVAVEMMPELHGGGYMLGDGEYDASPVYDAAGAAGYQLLAPREHPEAGLGHHYQSPYRLRCIELMRSSFGQGIYRLRGDIEREYGVLTSFSGGLSPLPAWVRHQNRVWMWAAAKLVINAVRIVRNKRLAA